MKRIFLLGLLISVVLCQEEANFAPRWVDDLQRVWAQGIREDTVPGTILGRLIAVDPENDPVSYSVAFNDVLTVDATSGDVSLLRPLDREVQPFLSVTFYTKDIYGSGSTAEFDIIIQDVNDNTPMFTEQPYSAQAGEHLSNGSVVFPGLLGMDSDLGFNADMDFSCVDDGTTEAQISCATFAVVAQPGTRGYLQGALVLKRSLDYETKSRYVITLEVKDRGVPGLSSRVTFPISVTDSQDTPPAFIAAPFNLAVGEGTSVGTSVGVLQARDQDMGNPRPIKLSIANDPLQYFSLDDSEPEDGIYKSILRVRSKLDREAVPNGYSFIVEAMEVMGDGSYGLQAATIVTVTLHDANDNAPEFDHSLYEVSVAEGLPGQTSLANLNMLVTDADGDANNHFRLELIENDEDVFDLSVTQGVGKAFVTLVVAKPDLLDYEVAAYRRRVVKVVAREVSTSEQKSSTATVVIDLFDMNDNVPQFDQDIYQIELPEDQPRGQKLTTITASDRDTGRNAFIMYDLQGEMSQYFRVDRYKGEISLVGEIDYQHHKHIDLTLVATDSGGQVATSVLSVEVMPPTLVSVNRAAQGPFQSEVNSGSSTLNPQVFLVSTHSGTGLRFSIASGNTVNEAFRINPITSELYLQYPVTYADTLGGVGAMFVLQVAITNSTTGQTSTTLVHITVTEMNVYAPEFTQTTYQAIIPETALPETLVYTVQAADQDSSQTTSGDITYDIIYGGMDNFQIGVTSGMVSVRRNADLTIETSGASYRILVTATDKGSPRRTGTAELLVTVSDVNNQAPTFQQATYFGMVNTGALQAGGISVLRVTAQDVDSTSLLSYSIRQDSFTASNRQGLPLSTGQAGFNFVRALTVNSTSGVIHTVATALPSSLQVSQVQFLYEVRDINAGVANPMQSASASVVIYIQSESNVVFNDRSQTIMENTAVGSDVLTLAASFNNGQDAQFTFEELSGTDPSDYFQVHSYTGKVTLERPVDYETLLNPDIAFQVKAWTSSATAVATVIVTVGNANDNIPSFLQPSYSFEIPASIGGGALVGIIVATDADRGNFGQLRYSISDNTMFNIDPMSGYLTIVPGTTFTAGDTHLLTVEAADDPGGVMQPQAYRTQINVTVFDDDNSVLASAGYQAVLADTTPANSLVLTVSLQVAGAAVALYQISAGNNQNLFRVEPGSGAIYTARSLNNYASANPYQLTVKATSSSNEQQSNSTLVTIWVLSPSSGSGSQDPMFLNPSPSDPTINIMEEPAIGSRITTILAYTPSTASALGVTYTLQPQADHAYFTLDANTGLLTNAQRLDREAKTDYQVTVRAQYGVFSSAQIITITLLDSDDNDPTFVCPGYSDPRRVSVDENQPAATLVTTVTACDADRYPHNMTYFFIVCGNEPTSAAGGLKPFRVNPSTGRLVTEAELDRELQAQYHVCVKVSSDPSHIPVNTDFDAAGSDNSIQRYIVTVADQDDNLPSFGYQNASFTAAVLAEASFHTAIVQIQAYDIDSDEIVYSLREVDIKFYPHSGGSQSATDAFTIDPITGVVYTNLVHYLDYNAGYFSLPVTATSAGTMSATSTLVIYLIRSAQLMRFTFRQGYPPERVVNTQNAFTSSVSNVVSQHVNVNSLRYRILDDGRSLDFDSTEMCFHVVNTEESTVMTPDEVKTLFGKHRDDLMPIYNQYGVDSSVGMQRCDVKLTTIWWSGYWYLWWILIALAILVFLLAIICMACLASKYKKTKNELPYKPYTLLDPFVIPYEYEETTVHM